MKKNKNFIVINIILAIAILVVIFTNVKDNNVTDTNYIKNVNEKRQDVKVPPIEITENTTNDKSSITENITNIENKGESNKSQEKSPIKQKIQEEPTTPTYVEVENLPKVLNVEEPTTSESMKKPEVIHKQLTTETTTFKEN